MARKNRIWFPGAKFHITSRGVRKKALFHDQKDYEYYLRLLAETMLRYPFTLHSYCLMTNHIHLQLETISTPPGNIMRHLHSKYAKYFNNRNDFIGHVFEKRYDAEWIDNPGYEIDVSKYIHLNPLKAQMVDQLEDYPWSSYRAYVLEEENPLLTKKQILSYFSQPQHSQYREFLYSDQPQLHIDENGKFVKNNIKPVISSEKDAMFKIMLK